MAESGAETFTLSGQPIGRSDLGEFSPSTAPGARAEPAAPPPTFQQQREQQDRQAAAQPKGKQQQPAATAPPIDQAGRFLIGEDLALTEAEIRDAVASKAERDLVRAALPTPQDYQLILPTDFTAPDGVEFSIDESSDHARRARDWAYKFGVSQQAFTELLGIHAATQIEPLTLNKAARDAQVDALGVNSTARVTAVVTWMDAKGYGALKPMLVTADMVKTFEKMMADSTGGGSFSQSHREADEPRPNFDNMNFKQARAAQDAHNARQRQSGR